MRIEVPEFKRCCFCVPLRYGLLVWSYLILIPNSLIVIQEALYFKHLYTDVINGDGSFWLYNTKLIVIFLLRLGISVFAVLLIVAAHKKSVKLLKVYFKCSLTLALLNLLFTIMDALYDICAHRDSYMFHRAWFWAMLVFFLLIGLIDVGMQLYIIVLVRSEILKLENNDKYEFSNMAAESERAYRSYYEPETNINEEKTTKNNDSKEMNGHHEYNKTLIV